MSASTPNDSRRRFLTKATSALGLVGAAGVAVPFLKSWSPSAAAKAAGAPVSVDVTQLEPGAQLTVEWRGKPIWILRRSKEMIAVLEQEDQKEKLRDPLSEVPQQPSYAKNLLRSRKKELLVLIGSCTHLGCSPTFRPEMNVVESGWKGGYYCPCHGSKFDLAGRVYKGVPAPMNLQVPPYTYLSDNVIVIGLDKPEGQA